MDMIRISADEEKPALELTPEIIGAIKEDSSKRLPDVEIAKQKFIEQAKSLKPSTDKEVLDQLWDDYTSSIKALPKTSHEAFPDYETWFEENKYNLVEWFNEHLKTPKVQDPFQKIISESGVDPEAYIKDKIAPGMYQRSLALDKCQSLGLTPAKQSENPVIAFNSLMDSYSRGLANHFTNELDNIVAQYKDGSFVKLVGSGSQSFPTKNLVRLGGAGNGLLSLSRAIRSGTGVLPSVIKIEMGASTRVGESYNYDSGKINQTNSTFNVLLAYFIKPLVDPQKVSLTYPERNIVLGQPNNFGTITNNINGLLSKFLPKIQGKKVMEVAAEYGLDMDAKTFESQILTSADMSNVDTKWNQIQSEIVAKYKENLDKFLTVKFPDTKVQKLGTFRPETSSNSATQEIKKTSANYGPGMAVPRINPQERKTQQNFELGK